MSGDTVFKIRIGHDVFLLFKGLLCYHEENTRPVSGKNV